MEEFIKGQYFDTVDRLPKPLERASLAARLGNLAQRADYNNSLWLNRVYTFGLECIHVVRLLGVLQPGRAVSLDLRERIGQFLGQAPSAAPAWLDALQKWSPGLLDFDQNSKTDVTAG